MLITAVSGERCELDGDYDVIGETYEDYLDGPEGCRVYVNGYGANGEGKLLVVITTGLRYKGIISSKV